MVKRIFLAFTLALAAFGARDQIRQSPITRPEPDQRTVVEINPPTFRWPAAAPPYTLEMGRSPDFARPITVAVPVDTFYRPLQPMEPGRWYWRLRSKEGTWGPAVSFVIPAAAVRWPIASWESALDHIPAAHPRLWVTPADVPKLRAKAAGPLKEFTARWSAAARKYIGQPLPLERDKPIPEANDFESKTAQRVSSLTDAYATTDPASELAFLYLLTGDEDFAREATRRALAAARLDPDGYTSTEVSDFADGSILEGVARVYDYLHPILTEDQRRQLRNMLRARCERTFRKYRPSLEQNPISAHAWQRVLMQATAAALAIHGEAPETREWIGWSLRLTAATFPWWGGADGGSAEGATYYESASLETLAFRDLFHASTGVDIAGNPWFRGNSRYQIYSHPPGGLRSSFGDNGNRISGPGAVQKLTALRLATISGDACAAAYAGSISEELPTGRHGWLSALWGPFSEAASCSPALPPANVFRDIGVMFLHTAMADPARNVFFEFKSSPYGSHNHAHADQNSFNVAVGGLPLIVDSGYYAEYADPHHYGYTVRTKAHNAILIDGEGQAHRNLDAYGEIVRFEQGDGFAYVQGACPRAYHQAEMERADRHVLWLAPGTFVIADHLSGAVPHRYDWLLHGASAFEIEPGGRAAVVKNARGRARITFLAPAGLKLAQTSGFDPPPKAWMRAAKRTFPDQWHLTATTSQTRAEERFLAVIQVAAGDGDFAPVESLGSNPNFRRAWRDWMPFKDANWDAIFSARK